MAEEEEKAPPPELPWMLEALLTMSYDIPHSDKVIAPPIPAKDCG